MKVTTDRNECDNIAGGSQKILEQAGLKVG